MYVPREDGQIEVGTYYKHAVSLIRLTELGRHVKTKQEESEVNSRGMHIPRRVGLQPGMEIYYLFHFNIIAIYLVNSLLITFPRI